MIAVGAAACAACCAGPIVGFVAALGVGALAGALLFGVPGLVIAAFVGALLVMRRRRRRQLPVEVDLQVRKPAEDLVKSRQEHV